MPGKKDNRNYKTDIDTNKLFTKFANENKINEQMRERFEALDNDEGVNKPNISMSTSDDSGKKSGSKSSSGSDSDSSKSTTKGSTSKAKSKVDFASSDSKSDSSSDSNSSSGSVSKPQVKKTPYSNMVAPNGPTPIPSGQPNQPLQPPIGPQSNLYQNALPTALPFKPYETAEQRRARQREVFTKLEDLKTKGIRLSRKYHQSDDPDEMEEEYKKQRDRKDKEVQVKFYKNSLLMMISGAEFLNDKYDPFDFKLKDWSKQFATEQDDYTEVLEELYEKYKDKGAKMIPEVRLLLMIVMSALTYHLSNTLFSSQGMQDAVKNNPNMMNKILQDITGIRKTSSDLDEPSEAISTRPNNKRILDLINNRNNKDLDLSSDSDSDDDSDSDSVTKSRSKSKSKSSKALKESIERERRLLEEQRVNQERVARQQQERYDIEMQKMKHHMDDMLRREQHMQQRISQLQDQSGTDRTDRTNRTDRTDRQPLPPNHLAPNPYANQQYQNQHQQISPEPPRDNLARTDLYSKPTLVNPYDSILGPSKKPSKTLPKNTKNLKGGKMGFDEILDSLNESSSFSINDVINSASRKKMGARRSSAKKTPSAPSKKKDTPFDTDSDSSSADLLSTLKRGKGGSVII